jgi:glutamate-1-semialdehyde 2,1-aminomutase
MPEPGWLESIRRLCDEYGIVLIMDEVKTGFRLAKGGAQEYFGVKADLVTYAKAMGNGYPAAAFGGQRDIMEQIGQGVSHGGTFVGNRVSMAATNATLDIIMKTNTLDIIAQRGRELQTAISEVLERTGLPFVVTGHPSMSIFWFAEEAPKEYRDWLASDRALYKKVAAGLIKRGVMPEPDSREPWFICAVLSSQDIAETANALEDTMRELSDR